MSIATIEIQPRVQDIEITNEQLSVWIQDGRIVSVPLTWYPRLLYASAQERADWRVFEDSDGRDVIHWEALDEFIPVVALLTGTPSRESQRSLKQWLHKRKTSK